MPPAVFRADGSSTIGMGHVMRCMAFAAGLNKLGVESLFVTRAFDHQISDVIRSSGFEVEEIASDTTSKGDSKLTMEIAADHDAKLIVTDVCHRQTVADPEGLMGYHRSLTSEFFTIGLAGDGDLTLPTDIMVIPYVGFTGAHHAPDHQQVQLLGPSYFIFRPEFVAASEAQRMIARQGDRLLITVGGSDELHLTCVILESVCAISKPPSDLKVVLGPGFSDRLKGEVANILGRFSGNYELLEQPSNLADVMLWADLAVIGDGLTKYEAALTGMPSIMVCRPDKQLPLNREFAQHGSVIYLGYDCPLDSTVITQQVERLMGDAKLRRQMSDKGKAIVDGKGLGRILEHIPDDVLN